MTAGKSKILLITTAWIAILSASDLFSIIWLGVLHKPDIPSWIFISQFSGICISILLTLIWPEIKDLRGFLWSLAALCAGEWISFGIQCTDLWINWTYGMAHYQKSFARVFLSLIPCLLMILTLLGSSIDRNKLFLKRGNLKALGKIPFSLRLVSWSVIGPSLLLIFTLPLILQLTLTLQPDFNAAKMIISALPVILTFSVINAASEEFRFRSVLIARLKPLLGPGHTLILTSALFGIGHWFGHPSGPTGVLLSGIAGWVWGKGMIDTKGFFWSWFVHMVQDIAILSVIVIS